MGDSRANVRGGIQFMTSNLPRIPPKQYFSEWSEEIVDKSAIADALFYVIMADDSINGIRLISDRMSKIAKMRQA